MSQNKNRPKSITEAKTKQKQKRRKIVVTINRNASSIAGSPHWKQSQERVKDQLDDIRRMGLVTEHSLNMRLK